MRQSVVVLLACLAVLAVSAVAEAKNYKVHPGQSDLWDLDHTEYYTWGIDLSIPANEPILGATLLIDDLRNWQVENDRLFIHLLDNPALGTRIFYDNEGGGDNFHGQGRLLTTYRDNTRPSHPPADWWTYTFTAADLVTLNQYAADGRFGFGFDPDCHYYNSGITLTLETQVMPEPVTALLAAPALALINRMRGRRRSLA